MKALSVRQPWAWLIANGHKKIENRNWTFEPKFRGRFAIHAAKGCTRDEYESAVWFAESIVPDIVIPQLASLERGGIVATADLVGCIAASDNPWFMGRIGLMLANIEQTTFQPCKGQLGFFDVELEQRGSEVVQNA